MQFRVDADDKLAGKWFLGFFSPLPAKVEIIVHRLLKCHAQLVDGAPLEGNHVAGSDHVAVKQSGTLVVFCVAEVALVRPRVVGGPLLDFHGVTPAWRRKFLTDCTAPALVSGRGCGRWKVALRPFKATRTREPLPSVISAFTCRSRDSI